MSQALSSAAKQICPLLIDWAKGHTPSEAQKQEIVAWENRYLRRVWGSESQRSPAPMTVPMAVPENAVKAAVEARAELLQKVVRRAETGGRSLPLSGTWSDRIALLWILWLPLAQQLDRKQRSLGRPFIQGILGGQGTGKTTLSKILQFVLAQLGHETVALSIDDLYLTYAQRQALLKEDSRLIWRGPPGTHDIELGIETLAAIRSADASQYASIPQFDKSLHGGQGDRTAPLACKAPTIVLFEGWFIGVKPLPTAVFEQSELPYPIVTPSDRQFARDCNQRLKSYMPLWGFLDALMVLYPRDYRFSKRWRQEAEHKMRAAGKAGLSDNEIADFVSYFWKALHPELFIKPLTHSTAHSTVTDLVVYIESDHSVSALKAPAFGYSEATDCV